MDGAHQYGVVANRLDLHMRGGQYHDRELVDAVRTARDSLLKASKKADDDNPKNVHTGTRSLDLLG